MKKKIVLGVIIVIIIGSVIGIKAATTIQSNKVIYKEKTLDVTLDDLFYELYEGKLKLATSITNKGVETTSDNTLEEMASNIDLIETGASLNKIIYRISSSGNYKYGDGASSWHSMTYTASELGLTDMDLTDALSSYYIVPIFITNVSVFCPSYVSNTTSSTITLMVYNNTTNVTRLGVHNARFVFIDKEELKNLYS